MGSPRVHWRRLILTGMLVTMAAIVALFLQVMTGSAAAGETAHPGCSAPKANDASPTPSLAVRLAIRLLGETGAPDKPLTFRCRHCGCWMVVKSSEMGKTCDACPCGTTARECPVKP